jgi:hypothetical protein
MNKGRKSWHAEVISAEVRDTANRLAGMRTLSNFYLAGGTALGLHLGHRRSVDLDFFTAQAFNEGALIAALQELPNLSILSQSEQTVYMHVAGTKVSFIGYDYPMLFPVEHFEKLAVADVRDIAAMKMSALASRGSRRDFVDLYVVACQYGLRYLLELFRQKFANANYSTVHVRKALTYFADADKEPMPDMLTPLSWKQLKEYFLREVSQLGIS